MVNVIHQQIWASGYSYTYAKITQFGSVTVYVDKVSTETGRLPSSIMVDLIKVIKDLSATKAWHPKE